MYERLRKNKELSEFKNGKKEKQNDNGQALMNSLLIGAVSIRTILLMAEAEKRISVQTYTDIMKTFEPLQHVTSVCATYFLMGIAMGIAEFINGARQARNEDKKIGRSVAGPLLGIAAASAYQITAETPFSSAPGSLGVADNMDFMYGMAAIVPSYFVAKKIFGEALNKDGRRIFKKK